MKIRSFLGKCKRKLKKARDLAVMLTCQGGLSEQYVFQLYLQGIPPEQLMQHTRLSETELTALIRKEQTAYALEAESIIRDSWGWPECRVSKCEVIYPHVWRVNDRFIMKAARDEYKLKKDVTIAGLLAESAFEYEVPRYLDSMAGEPIYHNVVLMDRMKGDKLPITGIWQNDAADDILFQAGALLGKLHEALNTLPIPGEFLPERCLESEGHMILKLLPILRPAKYRLIKKEYRRLEKFRQVNPTTRIHGDMNQGNIMVDGSKVTGVLDFVECRVDSPIYDIAYFILELAMSYQAVQDNGLFVRRVRAFLSGICRGRHFTETEIASLPTYLRILGCRFYVFFCVERIKPLKKIVRLAERLIERSIPELQDAFRAVNEDR